VAVVSNTTHRAKPIRVNQLFSRFANSAISLASLHRAVMPEEKPYSTVFADGLGFATVLPVVFVSRTVLLPEDIEAVNVSEATYCRQYNARPAQARGAARVTGALMIHSDLFIHALCRVPLRPAITNLSVVVPPQTAATKFKTHLDDDTLFGIPALVESMRLSVVLQLKGAGRQHTRVVCAGHTHLRPMTSASHQHLWNSCVIRPHLGVTS
jgi:hypothetical protein